MIDKKIIDTVKKAISEETHYEIDALQNDELFETIGLESVIMVSIINRLEQTFGNLPKTLFFECRTINELAEYLQSSTNQENTIKEEVNNQKISSFEPIQKKQLSAVVEKDSFDLKSKSIETIADVTLEMSKYDDSATYINENKEALDDEIAIIGIHGRFPMANNLDELWNNLAEGKDCITEIPDDLIEKNKLFGHLPKSKWGGFIQGVDEFDPLFFNISNKEAEMLDPQERLFLEEVYHTLEDSGYTKKRLQGTKVGVYVGVMWNQYQLYGAKDGGAESFIASVANRISYFFDFTGPSIGLDTMCSSSLTSVYLACQDLKNKDIDYAIAGGTNVDVHPNKHLYLAKMGFAAHDGRCRSFGEGGTGYVPGDGVGAIMLKRVSDAVRDGDKIYAVIKGIEVNHSGRSTGYSAPNPKSQIELMEKAFSKTDIDPSTVGYIEMHGTGTALGDPIEVRAASKFFSKYINEKQICPIGSIKSNIGHLEAAAGFSQIAKVLLQFRNSKLVPSIHSSVLNTNIDFKDTPFYVQQNLQNWNDKYDYKSETKKRMPKVSTISSLGAGGSNAFMILEEWISEPKKHIDITLMEKNNNQRLILLSAKTKERLKVMVSNFIDFLKKSKEKLEYKANLEAVDVLSFLRNYIASTKNISLELVDENDVVADFDIDKFELMKYLEEQISINLKLEILEENVSLLQLSEKIYSFVEKIKQLTYRNNIEDFLDNLSYTLQVGKEHMNVRTSIIASDIDEIIKKLNMIINESEEDSAFANLSSKKLNIKMSNKEDNDLLESLLIRNRLEKLNNLWLKGVDVPWEKMYESNKLSIISTPVYPFEKEQCWIEQLETSDEIYENNFKVIDVVKHYDHTVSENEFYNKLPDKLKNNNIKSFSYSFDNSVARFNLSAISYDELIGVINQALWYQFNILNKNNFNVDIKNMKIVSKLPEKGYINFILDKNAETGKAYVVNTNMELCVSLSYKIANHLDRLFPEKFFYDIKYNEIINYEIDKTVAQEILIVFTDKSKEIASNLRNQLAGKAIHQINLNSPNYTFDYVKKLEKLDEVYFLSGLSQEKHMPKNFKEFQDYQKNGIIALFKLVSVLNSLSKNIKLKVLTNNTADINLANNSIQPTSSPLTGFARGIAKEIPKLDVEIIDIDTLDSTEESLKADLQILSTGVEGIKEYFLRNGKIFEQTLKPISVENLRSNNNYFKKDGIYALLGGNGTVGKILTEYLAKNYNAKIIWIGRRNLDDSIKIQIEKTKSLNGELSYYSSDISNEKSTFDAFEKIAKEKGKIDGIIHCAMDFKPQRFSTLDEQKIVKGISAKVYGGYILNKIVEKFAPGFVLMFSSAESFTASVGWSIYSAACNFKDSLSRYINSSSRKTKSIIVNWGFWQLPDKEDNELFIRKGIYPIDDTLGMQTLEYILSSEKTQTTAMNVSDKVLDLMKVVKFGKEKTDTKINNDFPKKDDMIPTVNKAPIISVSSSGELKNALDNEIKKIISDVLKINISKIKSDMDLSNYGIDSIVVSDIHSKVEALLGCSIPATLLLENETLNDVLEYLISNNYANNLIQPSENIKEDVEEKIISIVNMIKKDELQRYLSDYGDLYHSGKLKNIEQHTILSLSEFYKTTKENFVHFTMSVNETKIEGFVIGQGKPILMVSPIALTAPIWTNQFSKLCEEHMLVVIHQPGYGLSEKVKESNNSGVSKAIISALKALNINKDVTIFASCFGSIVAAHLAKHHSDIISKMCFIGGFYDGSDLPPIDLDNMKLEDFQKMTAEISGSIGKDFDIVVNNLVETSNEEIDRIKTCKDLLLNSQCANSLISLRYLNEMKKLSTAEWLSTIEQPVLCMYGTLDSVIPPKRSDEISKMVKNSSIVRVQGAGHYPYLTHPEEFNKIVDNFIKEEE